MGGGAGGRGEAGPWRVEVEGPKVFGLLDGSSCGDTQRGTGRQMSREGRGGEGGKEARVGEG